MTGTVDRSVQNALTSMFAANAQRHGMDDGTLKGGGGGGTSDGMDTIDAKIEASEARTDTKFAELRGDLKDFATKGTVWQATAVIIATLLAAMAFGGDRFDAGIGMADVRQVQLDRDQKQDESVSRIEQKLDKLIAAQPKPK